MRGRRRQVRLKLRATAGPATQTRPKRVPLALAAPWRVEGWRTSERGHPHPLQRDQRHGTRRIATDPSARWRAQAFSGQGESR